MGLYTYLFIEIADPRVQNWPMMTDCNIPLLLAVLYLLVVLKLGPWIMEERKPYKLTNIIRCYNIFQIISCSIIFIGMGLNGWFDGQLSFGCEPVDYSNNPRALRLAAYMWWTYILKIIEFIETIFFVLRKKDNQVSNLHIYHHTSSLLMAWGGAKYVAGGMGSFPIFLNSLVHVIMYAYYFLSTLGPKWQKKLKAYKNKITAMQMIQFTVILLHTMQAFSSNCNFPNTAIAIFMPNIVLVFYMFYKFYQDTYNKVKSK